MYVNWINTPNTYYKNTPLKLESVPLISTRFCSEFPAAEPGQGHISGPALAVLATQTNNYKQNDTYLQTSA